MPDATNERGMKTPALQASHSGRRIGGWIDRNRIFLLGAVVIGVMAVMAPGFLTAQNMSSILKTTSVNIFAAVGLTIVMICGHLDLSFGSTATLGGMLVIGLQPELGWAGGTFAALIAGALVGIVNGLLVSRAKIGSFIVTLGTMIIVQGLVNMYCGGGTLNVSDFRLADFLDRDIWVLSPRVILAIAAVGAFAVMLSSTVIGRNFHLIGGNPQTAWYAGLSSERYLVGAFTACGALSAFGGAVNSMATSSANPTSGSKSLMLVIAAVIIGGTSMKGGKGSVVHSTVAVFTLTALINGLGLLGAGFEIQLVASGIVLATIILYDAVSLRRQERKRGIRPDLLAEMRAKRPGR
ncbi:MAG TPA: ABC transporter permease [Candidatus Brocadiia bacterium]|nr:ABC transporter permease [Candidatus Brocadiia bacterium]